MGLAPGRPFGQPLLDGVLMRPAECREHQLACIRLPRRHRHPGATLVHGANLAEIPKVQSRINSVHVQVQGHRDDVQVAGALAIAKQGALDTIGAREQSHFRRRHPSATIVMGVQTHDQ